MPLGSSVIPTTTYVKLSQLYISKRKSVITENDNRKICCPSEGQRDMAFSFLGNPLSMWSSLWGWIWTLLSSYFPHFRGRFKSPRLLNWKRQIWRMWKLYSTGLHDFLQLSCSHSCHNLFTFETLATSFPYRAIVWDTRIIKVAFVDDPFHKFNLGQIIFEVNFINKVTLWTVFHSR